MFRSFAEKLARNLVFRRRLPREFGYRPLFVTPDSALSYLKPGYGAFKDLIVIAKDSVYEGDYVWDIGGNVGLFSFMAAHKVGSDGNVVCVEPDPCLASLVQRSAMLRRNRDRAIHVLCTAASSRCEIANFCIAARGRSSSALENTALRTQSGGTRHRQFVPTITLDSMLSVFPPPTFLKIDVEGAEALVLQGGQRVLKDCRPRIYIEVGPQQSVAVSSMLHSYDYQLYDGDKQIADQMPRQQCPFNTLAIPIEQSQVEQKVA